jgi:hypothetical protein
MLSAKTKSKTESSGSKIIAAIRVVEEGGGKHEGVLSGIPTRDAISSHSYQPPVTPQPHNPHKIRPIEGRLKHDVKRGMYYYGRSLDELSKEDQQSFSKNLISFWNIHKYEALGVAVTAIVLSTIALMPNNSK